MRTCLFALDFRPHAVVFSTVLFPKEMVIEVPATYNGRCCQLKARKLMRAGATRKANRKRTLGYDIQSDGEVTGSDERVYPTRLNHPASAPGAPGLFSRRRRHVARRWQKALSRRESGRHSEKPLVVYDLDEKGEPKGKAARVRNGQFSSRHFASAFRSPRVNPLYNRLGRHGLFTMPLKNGSAGDPQAYTFGYNAKSSMLPSDRA